MLKKIYQELVAIRKELQAIRSSVEFIREHPFDVVTDIPLPRSPNHDNKSVRNKEIKGITIDLPTHDIQQATKENK